MDKPFRTAIIALLALVVFSLLTPQAQAQTFTIDPAFSRYYWRNDGIRLLGWIETGGVLEYGRLVQYFEKARLEDHSATESDPRWSIMYGRVVAELIELAPYQAINGIALTYGELRNFSQLQPAPVGHSGGPMPIEGGVFVPATADQSSGPGYVVPDVFWGYMARADRVPSGWLHGLGLPLTNAFQATALKSEGARTVLMQAFERGTLTFDPLNPADWQVERGNTGMDAVVARGAIPVHAEPRPQTGIKSIEIDLSAQWLYAYDGDLMVFDAPISSGKDGFETVKGRFKVERKYVKKDMQGEERGEEWDVPDVPHVMFFHLGFAIHGAYWHNRFGTGERRSHGCVNLSLSDAEWLYNWAPLGTTVLVYE
jgi:hypothetical protein